jgi:hypothetical protein
MGEGSRKKTAEGGKQKAEPDVLDCMLNGI